MSMSGFEAGVIEQPLAITASSTAYYRDEIGLWEIALRDAGIMFNRTISPALKHGERLASDLPLPAIGEEPLDVARFAEDWRDVFSHSSGLLVINYGVGFVRGLDHRRELLRVQNYIGPESDRAMQRALGSNLPVILSDGPPQGHPSPFMHPEALLRAEGVMSLDPNLSVGQRVALLPSMIGGLLIEPPTGGHTA